MSRYLVTIDYKNRYEAVIEADIKDEAIMYAEDEADDGFFLSDCEVTINCEEIAG